MLELASIKYVNGDFEVDVLDNEQKNELINKLLAVVSEGDFDEIKRLILSEECRPFTRSSNDTVFFVPIVQHAILLKQTETVRLLLDIGVEPLSMIVEPDSQEKYNFLSFSARVDHLPVTQLLAEFKPAQLRVFTLIEMRAALNEAVKWGNYDTAVYFLTQGCEFNQTDLVNKLFDMEQPPKENDLRIVNLLLQHKPDIQACFYHAFNRLRGTIEYPSEALDKSYYFTIKTLLQDAPVTNLLNQLAVSALWYFLRNFDISNANLTNILVYGKHLTREQLLEEGVRGVDKAILSSSEQDEPPNVNADFSALIHFRQQLHDAITERREQEYCPSEPCSSSGPSS